MKIILHERTLDFDGPCIDIVAENFEEAFELGTVAQQLWSKNKCVWRLEGMSTQGQGIRIPIIDMTEHGLAKYNNSEVKG